MDAPQRSARRLVLAAVLLAIAAAGIAVLARDPEASLSASAAGGTAARLEFTAPPGATAVEILRDGRLLDRVGPHGGAWTDRLLWPGTEYRYRFRIGT